MSLTPDLAISLQVNAAAIHQRIEAACRRAGRDPGDVHLIWVSKTHPVEALVAARRAGAFYFGENRPQEVLEKFPLPDDPDAASNAYALHLIGHLQRNKVRKVLPLCAAIHSIDSPELWETCGRIAGELGLTRQVFLQINTSREPQKSGFAPDTLLQALEDLPAAPHLQLIGFMTMGPVSEDPDATRACFKELKALLRQAQDRFAGKFPLLRHLSMGMSGDFEIAVEEGATWVRIGSALFGKR